MLLFHCTQKTDLDRIRTYGIEPVESIRIWTSLEKARNLCPDLILVIDDNKLPAPIRVEGDRARVQMIPVRAIANIDPYLPPKPVIAAGGFIVRSGREEPEVLVIFRRGVWDLPKGKLDKGETIEDCALREVREEVGIKSLHILREAGTTIHGYQVKGAYMVKTTYWYFMRTNDTVFTPQQEEDIEEITWMPWSHAVESIGYETLRDHMKEISETVQRVLVADDSPG